MREFKVPPWDPASGPEPCLGNNLGNVVTKYIDSHDLHVTDIDQMFTITKTKCNLENSFQLLKNAGDTWWTRPFTTIGTGFKLD